MEAPRWQHPYTVQLDPDTARSFATNGATILLLGVPEATPIGLDQQVFLTGPQFKGMKMLPPGVHFLSFQARSIRDGTLSPPVSTFVVLKPQQVFVRRWDPASEGLVELDEDEAERYAAGVARFDFDRHLAPYDLQRYSQWASLSGCISSTVLQQLLPPGGEISIMAEAVDPGLMNPSSAAEKRLQQQLEEGRARMAAAMQVDRPEDTQTQQQQQPEHQQDAAGQGGGAQQQQTQQQQQQHAASRGGRCHYTPLPRVLKLQGASPAQLTALNLDKTALLQQVISRYQQHSSSTGNTGSSSGTSGAQGASNAAAAQQRQGGQQAERVEGIEVVGELQFAFIAFVFGQSLEGYMHWKQLLVLLLGCVSGPLESHTSLFVAFLATLTAQLQLGFGMPGGSSQQPNSSAAAADSDAQAQDVGAALLGAGLVEELLPDSFLKQAFRGFFEMLQDSSGEAPAQLLTQARQLEAVLAAGLGWDFRMTELLGSGSGSDDEFGPVVVELTAQQLAELETAGQ